MPCNGLLVRSLGVVKDVIEKMQYWVHLVCYWVNYSTVYTRTKFDTQTYREQHRSSIKDHLPKAGKGGPLPTQHLKFGNTDPNSSLFCAYLHTRQQLQSLQANLAGLDFYGISWEIRAIIMYSIWRLSCNKCLATQVLRLRSIYNGLNPHHA